MVTDLLPCPFCGAGETIVHKSHHWTGQQNIVLSVAVQHWCEPAGGVNRAYVEMKAKTEPEAIDKWNRRIKV